MFRPARMFCRNLLWSLTFGQNVKGRGEVGGGGEAWSNFRECSHFGFFFWSTKGHLKALEPEKGVPVIIYFYSIQLYGGNCNDRSNVCAHW